MFIMAMPPNMILVMYVIPCILSHVFFNKSTILYTCTYISLIPMTNKCVMTSFLLIKYLSVCLSTAGSSCRLGTIYGSYQALSCVTLTSEKIQTLFIFRATCSAHIP